MTSETALLDLDELWVGEARGLRKGKLRLLVIRLEDRVVCYDDRCPHLGFPLSEGRLEGTTLTCAAHGWVFDVETGLGINPGSCRLRSHPVRVVDGKVLLDVESET
ncbi:MAG: Rieske (2Fe-2S) protein [Myxococcota bacterium]